MQSSPQQSKRARTVGTQADDGDLRFYEGNDTAATMMPVEGMTGGAAAPEEGLIRPKLSPVELVCRMVAQHSWSWTLEYLVAVVSWGCGPMNARTWRRIRRPEPYYMILLLVY